MKFRVSSSLLVFALIIVLTLILEEQLFLGYSRALSSPYFQTQTILSWGRNVDGEAGFGNLLKNSFMMPTLNNDLVNYFISNQGGTYNLALEMPVGSEVPKDVALNVRHVTAGADSTTFVIDFKNTTSDLFISQHVFSCGYNKDGIAGIGAVPIIATDLTLNYAYTKNGNSQNPLFGKNISSIACGYSTCLACSEDGLTYIRQTTLTGGSPWTLVTLPSSFQDPETLETITNVKCSQVALGGKLGDETKFVLTQNGFVFSWGSFNKGIRGHGVDGTLVSNPTLIPTLRGMYHVSSTPDFADSGMSAVAAFVNATGAYFMGYNIYSFGTSVDYQVYNYPVFVSSLDYVTSGPIQSIHFGTKHVLILTQYGHVFTMGDNDDRQVLPEGGNGNIPTPTNLTVHFPNLVSKIVECSVSNFACLCQTENGNVYTWGNIYQAGITNNNVVNLMNIPNGSTPKAAKLLSQYGFVVTDNAVYSFGFNLNGQQCVSDSKIIKTPSVVATPTQPVAKLVTGDSCTFAIEHTIATSIEQIYLYGNCSNTLALAGSSPNPNLISFPYSALSLDSVVGTVTNFLDLSIHMGAHVMAVSFDGNAFSWGKNDRYQLGNNMFYTSTISNNLTLYSSALGFAVSQVATGFDHSVLLLSDGMTLYGVGGNAEGQLSGMYWYQGNNFDVQNLRVLNVTHVVNASNNEYITQVVAGHRVTFVLTNHGRVFGSGDNKKGQISSNIGSSNYWDFEQVKGGVMDTKRIRKIVLGTHLILLADDFTAMIFNQTSSLIPLPNSELIMDAFSSETNTYFITQSGNIYGMGSNIYFEISSKYNLSQISKPVLAISRSELGGMPYMGSCGKHHARLQLLSIGAVMEFQHRSPMSVQEMVSVSLKTIVSVSQIFSDKIVTFSNAMVSCPIHPMHHSHVLEMVFVMPMGLVHVFHNILV
ncbi:hypothetical protein C9374_002140 [Naegleria lovaniensis]|uniref:Uncharacterized protein n=1 Tax=Naegleria lovaniensis TaxID=51637 RepID=A0AA88GUF5_NAELO|nr:uncharacterized protein C9374_002140 [Naegleria lovaniensis]KAG2387105.1 hypothetical protein C9374_002140 [Naegleria lovaniensis]